MLSSIFLSPSQSGLQIARTANQEGPFPTKKTCLVHMVWSHLQQTLRVDQTCYWCCRLVVSAALDYCQLLLLATAGQLDQY